MSRVCTICRHTELEAIDKALVAGHPYRSVAKQYEASPPSVYRHWQDHLPATLVKAAEAEEVAHGSNLLTQVVDLQQKAMGILAKAEASGDLRISLGAIREVRSTLELLGKVTGELVHKVEHGGSVDHHILPNLTDEQCRALVAKAELAAKEHGWTVVEGEIVDG